MTTIELTLSKHLKVRVSERGDFIDAIDFRPAFDDWGDASMRVMWNRDLMALVDQEFRKHKAQGEVVA